MHFVFIPYGKYEEVERLFRDMRAQKHQLIIRKEGEKDRFAWIESQVRLLPGGIVEYVFPKEDRDIVLNTLTQHIPPNLDRYDLEKINILGFTPISLLRKALKLDPVPTDFKKDKFLLWIKDNVAIIPLGIRKDGDVVDSGGLYAGWTHEAI